MLFVAKTNTVVKRYLEQSSKLAPDQLHSFQKGQSIVAADFINLVSQGHTLVALSRPLKKEQLMWYLYNQHWARFISSTHEKVILDVPLFSQRDNAYAPSSTCNITSVAMVLAYFGIQQKNPACQFEDELYLLTAERKWDRHWHSNLTLVFKEYGVLNTFTVSASYDSIKAHLDKGYPCVISAKFTASGHIVVVTGYNQDGFYLNDPWGVYPYRSLKSEPHYFISYSALSDITYAKRGEVWCHFPIY